MADSSAIRAGRAFVEIFADTTKLEAALKNVGAKLKALGEMMAGWGKAMMAAGAAVVAPLLGLAKATGAMGENFVKMSQRTGIAVESLSALSYVASQTGTDMEAMETGIKRMQKTMEEAAGGSIKQSVDAFRDLGVSLDELRGLSPDEQFKRIGTAIAGLSSPSQRAALAMEIFGRQGTMLLPMLEQGKAGIDALMAKARELGLVMSTEAAQAAERFNLKLAELWQVVRKAGFDIGSILLPPLTGFINLVERVVVGAVKWLTANKELVLWTLAVGVGLAVAGAAVYAMGTAIVWAGSVLTGLVTIFEGVWTSLAFGASLIATVLTSPVLGAVAAIGVLGATMVWASGAGGKAIAWLGDQFNALKGFAMDSFHGIADAMQAGDIELAAKILWKTLEVAWRAGVNELKGVWDTFKVGFLNTVVEAFAGALVVVEFIAHSISNAWIKAVDAMTKAWIGFKNLVSNAVDTGSGEVAKILSKAQNAVGVHIMTADDATIDRHTAANKAANDTSAQSDLAGNASQTEADLKSEKDLHDSVLSTIGKLTSAVETAISKEAPTKTSADDAELEKLKAELKALLLKAKTEKNAGGGNIPGAGAPPGMPDMLPGINHAEKNVGFFSSAAANRSGATGIIFDRIAKAAEATAEHTKAMLAQFPNLNGGVNHSM